MLNPDSPAYPIVRPGPGSDISTGLTLRQHIATQVLQSLDKKKTASKTAKDSDPKKDAALCAKIAVIYADALIKELGK